MLVGTYTPPRGDGRGVERIVGGVPELLAEVSSPSFLARHATLPVLYAVAEDAGELVVVDATTGEVLQREPAGEAACHVRVDGDARAVVVACWGDGRVVRFTLDDDGLVTARTVAPAIVERDAASRAHASRAFGDGFVSTDLGVDLVRVFDARFVEVQRVALPRGSGPRHLTARGDLLYVDTEYSGEIVTIGPSTTGELELRTVAPARVGGAVDGDAAAEIALDPSGGWLTVGVRGSNVIAVSRILDDGSTEPVGEAPSGGDWPRHHVHVPDGILVAHERSSEITRLEFDAATGRVGGVVERIAVGSPTFLLP